MDWPESTHPVLTVLPRGMKRDGGLIGDTVVVPEDPARWTSKYGSIVKSLYGVAQADGLNEKGLGAHLLFLRATDFGTRQPEKPAFHAALWAQAAVDNAATVEEALEYVDTVQVVLAEAFGHKTTVHLALNDPTGDSSIIEYVGGKPIVHHDCNDRIMTNDPIYEEQLALLA